jgi:hypothetical protein
MGFWSRRRRKGRCIGCWVLWPEPEVTLRKREFRAHGHFGRKLHFRGTICDRVALAMPVINVKVRDGEGSWRMICELPSANVLVVGFREHWVPRRESQRTSCSVILAWNAGSSLFRLRLQTTWSSAAIRPRNSSVLRRPLPRTRKSHKAHPPCCASACAIAGR